MAKQLKFSEEARRSLKNGIDIMNRIDQKYPRISAID